MQRPFDLNDLLNKYNRPGGRYTYYPMHAKWKNNLNIYQWWDSVTNNYDPEVGIDLYIHLPFCESLCTFCGCNIRITHKHDEVALYLLAIKEEWKTYQTLLGNKIAINSFYLGGGSPNYLTPQELTDLLNLFNLKPHTYKSIELDPRKTSSDFLSVLKEFHFNVLSFGIQDTNSDVLNNVNRPTDFEAVKKIITLANTLDFEHINIDCIYGLTFQTTEALKKTVENVIQLKPNSLAFYPFARVPWQNNSQKVTGIFNDFTPEQLHHFFSSIDSAVLSSGQFNYLGMGHYIHKNSKTQKAFEVKSLRRYIMGFTTSTNSNVLIGLGVSSISSTPDGLIQNEKVLETYQFETLKGRSPLYKSHQRSEEEKVLSRLFEELICKNEFPIKKDIINNQLFINYLEMNFISFNKENQTGRVTEVGRYFLKNLCQLFE